MQPADRILLFVALAAFAHHHLDARLRWLAVTAIALRLVSLVINFTVGESANFPPRHVVAIGPAAGRAGGDGRRHSQSVASRRSRRGVPADAVLPAARCMHGGKVDACRRARRRQPHVLHGGEPDAGCPRLLAGRERAEHGQSLRARRRRRHGLRAQRRSASRQAARRRAERARARGRPGRGRCQSRHVDARHRSRQRGREQETARAVRLCARRAVSPARSSCSGFTPTTVPRFATA